MCDYITFVYYTVIRFSALWQLEGLENEENHTETTIAY